MHPPSLPSSPAVRWRAGAGVATAVVLLHAAVLAQLPGAAGPGAAGDRPQPLRVRQIVNAPPAAAARPILPPSARQPAPQTAAAATPPTLPTLSTPAAAMPVVPSNTATIARPEPALVAAAEATPAPSGSPLTESGGAVVPVYATRLPASQTLRYALRRGQQQGHAVLRWTLEGDAFSLSLNNEWRGAQALGSVSSGHVTGTGLAPDRHTESRRGRDLRAANFQYDSARITFSGPGVEYPLLPGSQDRLSWMLQLAAVVEANPALQTLDSEISMFVVGSRGDGEIWTFNVAGREDIDVPAGRVAQALHLRREPRRPYDTQAEVWLDPARGHLPARLRLMVRPTGEGTEFLLESAAAP